MKIINIVVGIGTALILGSLIVLGIRAFHPGPTPVDYMAYSPKVYIPLEECRSSDLDCIAKRDKQIKEQEVQQELLNQKQKEYDEAMKQYNRDVFLIANVIGILVFIGGFLVVFKTDVANHGVPVGIMLAGLWGIIYGYGRGWGSADDQLKFFVGLIVAILVIGGSMWLMNRYRQSHP